MIFSGAGGYGHDSHNKKEELLLVVSINIVGGLRHDAWICFVLACSFFDHEKRRCAGGGDTNGQSIKPASSHIPSPRIAHKERFTLLNIERIPSLVQKGQQWWSCRLAGTFVDGARGCTGAWLHWSILVWGHEIKPYICNDFLKLAYMYLNKADGSLALLHSAEPITQTAIASWLQCFSTWKVMKLPQSCARHAGMCTPPQVILGGGPCGLRAAEEAFPSSFIQVAIRLDAKGCRGPLSDCWSIFANSPSKGQPEMQLLTVQNSELYQSGCQPNTTSIEHCYIRSHLEITGRNAFVQAPKHMCRLESL